MIRRLDEDDGDDEDDDDDKDVIYDTGNDNMNDDCDTDKYFWYWMSERPQLKKIQNKNIGMWSPHCGVSLKKKTFKM